MPSCAVNTINAVHGRVRGAGGGLEYDETRYGECTPQGSSAHVYSKVGWYDVIASAAWVVTRTGGGRTGSIDCPLSSQATVEMGETQVVSTR